MVQFLEMVALTTFVVTVTGLLIAGAVHLAVSMEPVQAHQEVEALPGCPDCDHPPSP